MLPSLPSGYDATPRPHRSSFLIILILLTVLSITGSLVIIVYLRYVMITTGLGLMHSSLGILKRGYVIYFKIGRKNESLND